MPVSLAFRFPAGRYHATPHGHHVNEGLIEWPPSPWRILRALISVGYNSGLWNSGGPSPAARGLIEKLSAEPPRYFLPAAVGTHSRHYMPIGSLDNKSKIEKTKLVFDTWARIEDREMVAIWPDTRLTGQESCILTVLAERLNYLGRSESWVQGRVIPDNESLPEPNCFPKRDECRPGREQVALLVPVSASDFAAWRKAQLVEARAALPLPEGRKPSRTLLNNRKKAAMPYPADLIDCLQKDTAWLRSHGWNWPPGSRRVLYWRPAEAISVGAPKARTATRPEHRVQAMLLSLTNSSRNDHALPPVARTLSQAELLHRAVVGIASHKSRLPPPEITGRDRNRRPLRGPHQHAHINPLDLDDDGHLDHILIWAPGGLGAQAQAAVRSVRTTFNKGGIEPLRLALAAIGSLPDMARLPGQYGGHMSRLKASAPIWQSLTPFVPPRHVKARGKNTLEGQILVELRSRGFPKPAAVLRLAPISWSQGETDPARGPVGTKGETSWSRFRHFKLARQRGPQPPLTYGFAIRLEFERPVSGPIAIGYGSHFGLGLFEHCASSQSRDISAV
ncbi:MAG: type I-U CRISPR-associated protein Csb2 [Gemmatimonadetes bacterium]|nr:type I-U CRISPR-associated protein Csb2 [Gemmatimonadota bacterium]